MRHWNCLLAGLTGLLVVGAAPAQQPPAGRPPAGQPPANPQGRTRSTVVPPTTPAKITLTVRGEEARTFLTVDAAGADVRKTLTDMADKGGVRVLLAPSANGVITGKVDSQPTEAAIAQVAGMANLTVRRMDIPEASVASLTPDAAGRYAEALSGLPVGAVITDPATGKALTVAAKAPATPAGTTAVYYVQGRFSPEQERMARFQRDATQNAERNRAAEALNPASQDFVNKTAQALQQMPLQQRMQIMRNLQQQMRENMTSEERDQMRQMWQQGGRDGGPGGWRGRGPQRD